MICLIAASTILLSQADARTVDLEEKGPKIVCDEPFRVQWENEWERPWTLKVSFDYRTVGTGEKAVAVKLRGIKDDGEPAILPLIFLRPRDVSLPTASQPVLTLSPAVRRVTVPPLPWACCPPNG